MTKKLIFIISFLAIFGFLFNFGALSAKAMTVAEINTLIQQFQQRIAQLQQQLAELKEKPVVWCHDFKVNLKYGDRGSEVEALQMALTKEGFAPSKDWDMIAPSQYYFGELTASAVSGFQQKYKEEILAPWGIQYGTGFVCPATRAKLNSLYGCGTACTDTDGGKNFSIKGTVTANGVTKTDSCTYCTGACKEGLPCNTICGGVVEYYCDGNEIKSVEQVCPLDTACSDGACKSKSPSIPTATTLRFITTSVSCAEVGKTGAYGSLDTETSATGTGGQSYSSYAFTVYVNGSVNGSIPRLTKQPCAVGICRGHFKFYGTPTTAGNYFVTVVVNAGGHTASASYILKVVNPGQQCSASPVTTGKTITQCVNSYCHGTNSILTQVENADPKGIKSNSKEGTGIVCCDGVWWIDTRGSAWDSSCNGIKGGLQPGGWYQCDISGKKLSTSTPTATTTIPTATTLRFITTSVSCAEVGKTGAYGSLDTETSATGTGGQSYSSYAFTVYVNGSVNGSIPRLTKQPCAVGICRGHFKFYGTPTTAGNYFVTVVVNAGGHTASASYILKVVNPGQQCSASPVTTSIR